MQDLPSITQKVIHPREFLRIWSGFIREISFSRWKFQIRSKRLKLIWWKLSLKASIVSKQMTIRQNTRNFKDSLVWKWNENRNWDRDSSTLSLNGHARDSLIALSEQLLEASWKATEKSHWNVMENQELGSRLSLSSPAKSPGQRYSDSPASRKAKTAKTVR